MQYVLKILIDIEARDDLVARQAACALVTDKMSTVAGVREIVLQSHSDHKSIRINPDGVCEAQWNKGGHGKP